MSRLIATLFFTALVGLSQARVATASVTIEFAPPFSGSSDAILMVGRFGYCGYVTDTSPVLRLTSNGVLEVAFRDRLLEGSCTPGNLGRPQSTAPTIIDLRTALGLLTLPSALRVNVTVRLDEQLVVEAPFTFLAVPPRRQAVPLPSSAVFADRYAVFRNGNQLSWRLPNSIENLGVELGAVPLSAGVMRGQRSIPAGFAFVVKDFVVVFQSPTRVIIGSEGLFQEFLMADGDSLVQPGLRGQWQVLARDISILRGEIIRIEATPVLGRGFFHQRFAFRFSAGSGRVDCSRESGCRVSAQVDGVDVSLQVATLPLDGITGDRLHTRRVDPVEGELWELFAVRVE